MPMTKHFWPPSPIWRLPGNCDKKEAAERLLFAVFFIIIRFVKMRTAPASVFFSIILFLLNGSASGQLVMGHVADAVSRQPLEMVLISPLQTGKPFMTDLYGNFETRITGTETECTVSCVGYASQKLILHRDEPVTILLQPAPVNLKDVLVLSSAHFTKFNSIAKTDLNIKPVKNSQELLRTVPGLFIAQHAGGGKAEQIFLRGFDCDHGTDVAVSADGIPVNMVSHAHGQGYADTHFIIPETITNIDFGSGPYYARQGNLTTAGYVAFSTFDKIAGSRLQLEAGRFSTARALAMLDLIKKNKDRQSAYVAAEFNYTNGPTQHAQHFSRLNIFGKYNLAFNPSTQFTASVSCFSSKWDASGQVPSRAVTEGIIDRFGSIDPSEGGNTNRTNINLQFRHRLNNGMTWENQLWYSNYLFNLYSDFTFFLTDTVNGDAINQAEKRNLWGALSRLSKQYSLQNISLQSVLAAGLRNDAVKDNKLAHVKDREFIDYIKLGNIHEANAYVYLQQQVQTGKWLFDAGLRFDYFYFSYLDKLTSGPLPAQSKAILCPKLNIQYTASNQLQFFIKTGKGFHSNDTRVVVANAGHAILPAAWGADAGFIFKPTTAFLVHVAAWYLSLGQEFVYVGDDGNIEPSGETKRTGLDIIARYQFSRNFFATANINFTKPRSVSGPKGADYIPLAPTLTSTGGIYYKAQKGFNGGISYRYIKNRPANEDNSIVAKGYFITDISLNYTLPKYELGLSVENLFNAKWNEAQFATTSRLQQEAAPVTELNFTPGTPFFARLKLVLFF